MTAILLFCALGPGLWKTLTYETPDTTPIVFGGESRATDVKAREYCLYLDIFHPDGSATWGRVVAFTRGSHDWERRVGAYVPTKPVSRIQFFALCRGGKQPGAAEFRDLFLERRPGNGDRVDETRFSNRPFEATEEISFKEFRGVEFTPKTEKMPAGDFGRSPLGAGTSVIWTASSLRRVSPVDFPSAREALSPRLAFDVARRGAASAQVLVSTAQDVEWKAGSLTLGELRASDGTPFKGTFRWERVGYLPRVTGYRPHPDSPPPLSKWIPEPLLPAAPFRVRKGATQALWLTLTAAEDAKPGVYRGTVEVREGNERRGGAEVAVLVRDFALPKTFGLETSFSLMDGFLRLKYPSDWKRMRRMAQDLLLDARLNPDDISRTAFPDIEDLLHARARGMNRFTILNIVPEPKDPKSLWTCYVQPEEVFNEGFYPSFKARLGPYVAELRRHGLEKQACLYGFDERGSEYYEGIDRLWKRLRADFPDIPVLTTGKMYADLAEDWKKAGGCPTNAERLVTTDWYCPLTVRWNAEVTDYLRCRGKKVWWYTCGSPFWPHANFAMYEHPLAEARLLLGFQQHRFRADGFLFWHVNFWRAKGHDLMSGADVFFPAWTTADPMNCNGDGVFLYPGEDAVYPSIRLAALRDGVQDYEWLRIAEEKRGRAAADALSGEVVMALDDFCRKPADLMREHRRLGDLIEGRER